MNEWDGRQEKDGKEWRQGWQCEQQQSRWLKNEGGMAMAWRSVSLGPKERGALGRWLALTAPICCFGLSTAFSGERHNRHRCAYVGATAMIRENCESALLALSMSLIVQFGSLVLVPCYLLLLTRICRQKLKASGVWY
ncbi:hypothetical protein BDA96_04G295600 [Sorghum bicolor]|uniref:Uncharacterized protein n=2 Tax=Sorghum bicolor TaxID=4558 RepID=A0A194YT32_SORBI|nr:hypothetical protein BDA96_04G295600 [Sorghum bicolor]KXG30990.1 hypothetical protein SORBI_3004G277900 [Sorghum bicolor]